jgi:molybdenum cofactor biosynthesis enzyme MoaA
MADGSVPKVVETKLPPAVPATGIVLHDRKQISRKLRISLTDSCNLGCFFCHNEGQGAFGQTRADLIPAPDYLRIIKAAANAGIREVKLTGGEPLLYKRDGRSIVDLVADISSLRNHYHFGLSMTTNGLLLPRYAEELAEAGLDRVTVSLHTLDREKHSRLISLNGGRRDAPTDITDAIRLAVKARLTPVKVNMVLFGSGPNSNVSELTAIIRKCKDLGVSQLRLYTLLRHGRFPDHAAWYRFWDRELLATLGQALYGSASDTDDFADQALEKLSLRRDALYPKPTIVFTTGELEVTIEDLETGRFESRGLPDEGPYALRLSAAGQLRGVLDSEGRCLDLKSMLYRAEADDSLLAAFRLARRELLPLE